MQQRRHRNLFYPPTCVVFEFFWLSLFLMNWFALLSCRMYTNMQCDALRLDTPCVKARCANIKGPSRMAPQ